MELTKEEKNQLKKDNKRKRREERNLEIKKVKSLFPSLSQFSKNELSVYVRSEQEIELVCCWDYPLESFYFPNTDNLKLDFMNSQFIKPAKNTYDLIISELKDVIIKHTEFDSWVLFYVPDIPIKIDEDGNKSLDFDSTNSVYNLEYLNHLKERKDLFSLQQDKDIDITEMIYMEVVQIGYDSARSCVKMILDRNKINQKYNNLS